MTNLFIGSAGDYTSKNKFILKTIQIMAEKVKFQLEYLINSSPRILFPYLQEPNALSQWFADNVHFRESIYEFVWDGESKKAKIANFKDNKSIRFKWIDDEPYYFELEIDQDELTNDVALKITDHAKESDLENRKLIWDNSVEYLQSVIGA